MNTLLLLLAMPAIQDAPGPEPLAVETWISQTAVWPGDRLRYSVRLVIAPGVRLADEGLDATEIQWAPFHLLDFAQRDETRSDSVRVVTLTYELAATDLPGEDYAELPTLRFSYAETGGATAPQTTIPMKEMVVAGPRVPFRSMLDGDAQEVTIRDARAPDEPALPGTPILLVGVAGLLIGIFALARLTYPVVRGLVPGAPSSELPVPKLDPSRAIAALRQIPLVSAEDYERFYKGLYQIIREHLSLRFHLDYPGLTGLDGDGLRRAGIPDETARGIEEILRDGEELRYQKRLPEDAPQRARQALASVERLLPP